MFHKDKRTKDGHHTYCATCKNKLHRALHKTEQWKHWRRSKHLRESYGITEEDLQKILKLQGGICKICGTDTPEGKGWVVDHNHKTGEVRGILCAKCNTGLGMFGDSKERLQKAINYLVL